MGSPRLVLWLHSSTRTSGVFVVPVHMAAWHVVGVEDSGLLWAHEGSDLAVSCSQLVLRAHSVGRPTRTSGLLRVFKSRGLWRLWEGSGLLRVQEVPGLAVSCSQLVLRGTAWVCLCLFQVCLPVPVHMAAWHAAGA